MRLGSIRIEKKNVSLGRTCFRGPPMKNHLDETRSPRLIPLTLMKMSIYTAGDDAAVPLLPSGAPAGSAIYTDMARVRGLLLLCAAAAFNAGATSLHYGPSSYTAPGAFPTQWYDSYYNDPTATSAQPQPVISDPVLVRTRTYSFSP